MLNELCQDRLKSELEADERITWCGQPDPTLYMKTGFAAWLFFIPWTAFSLFWMAGASGFKMPAFDGVFSFFFLFGLPFLGIGIAGLCTPFFLYSKSKFTIYAVTNRRVLIIEGKKTINVRSYYPKDIQQVQRTENENGYGNLIVSVEYVPDSDGDQRKKQHGFFAIADVKNVQNIVAKLSEQDKQEKNLSLNK